jgi:hypothetical protein
MRIGKSLGGVQEAKVQPDLGVSLSAASQRAIFEKPWKRKRTRWTFVMPKATFPMLKCSTTLKKKP